LGITTNDSPAAPRTPAKRRAAATPTGVSKRSARGKKKAVKEEEDDAQDDDDTLVGVKDENVPEEQVGAFMEDDPF
jgi:hypothetical protein